MSIRAFTFPIVRPASTFWFPWLQNLTMLVHKAFRDLVLANTGSIYANKNITVNVASQSKNSFLRLYYNVDLQLVYPYLTAIIAVRDGVVTGITWDNACVFCGGFADECEENTYSFTGALQTQETSGQETKACFESVEACTKAMKNSTSDEGKRLCDITLYVAWKGAAVAIVSIFRVPRR
jgi:hypothetical protein